MEDTKAKPLHILTDGGTFRCGADAGEGVYISDIGKMQTDEIANTEFCPDCRVAWGLAPKPRRTLKPLKDHIPEMCGRVHYHVVAVAKGYLYTHRDEHIAREYAERQAAKINEMYPNLPSKARVDACCPHHCRLHHTPPEDDMPGRMERDMRPMSWEPSDIISRIDSINIQQGDACSRCGSEIELAKAFIEIDAEGEEYIIGCRRCNRAIYITPKEQDA